MDKDIMLELYEVIKSRKSAPQEGSYTSYLFEKGLDKILKKCGEECSEIIIAAKNNDKDEISNEICDLIYHILVLMNACDIPLNNVYSILQQRSLKVGNLKTFHQGDKES